MMDFIARQERKGIVKMNRCFNRVQLGANRVQLHLLARSKRVQVSAKAYRLCTIALRLAPKLSCRERRIPNDL